MVVPESCITAEKIIFIMFASTLVWLAINNARRLVVPDIVTLWGAVTGLVLSWIFPSLHDRSDGGAALIVAVQGRLLGGLTMYGLLTAGKMLFGKERVALAPNTLVVFDQTSVQFDEEQMLYDDIFYRYSDRIEIEAAS